MHPRSLLVVILALATSLACSGLLALGRPAPEPPPMDGSWASFGLPLDEGVVVHADADSLTVRWSGDRVRELAPDVDASLEAHGWMLLAAADRGDSHLLTYHKDGTTLVAALTAAGGTTVAQLSLR